MDPQTNPFAALSFMAAPAVLTNVCSVLILSTSNRLARAVDRARELTTALERPGAWATPVAQVELRELTATEERMLLLVRALRAYYLALGSFATATLLSLIGAVIATWSLRLLTVVLESLAIVVGITAVGALVRGALLLVRETRIVMGVLEGRVSHLRAEFVQRQETAVDEPSARNG